MYETGWHQPWAPVACLRPEHLSLKPGVGASIITNVLATYSKDSYSIIYSNRPQKTLGNYLGPCMRTPQLVLAFTGPQPLRVKGRTVGSLD